MSHPSIFVLRRFIETPEALDANEAHHVTACDTCAASLTRLAQQSSPWRHPADTPSARPMWAPVFAAALALVLVIPGRGEARSTVLTSPEGHHGVAIEHTVCAPAVEFLADAGVRN